MTYGEEWVRDGRKKHLGLGVLERNDDGDLWGELGVTYVKYGVWARESKTWTSSSGGYAFAFALRAITFAVGGVGWGAGGGAG